MKLVCIKLGIATVAVWATTGQSQAANFARAARSEQTTVMHVYKSYTSNCRSNIGVVKVLAKPLNGTLIPSEVDTTIGTSRINPAETAHCKGTPIRGFQVEYRSNPGFRGIDSFQIEVRWGPSRTEIDTFSVKVE